MVYLNIWLTVKNEADVAAVRARLAEAAQLCNTEPGCIRWEAYQSNNEPTRFLLHEQWESQAALDVHRTAPAYTTIYQPHILPLVTREAHPSTPVA